MRLFGIRRRTGAAALVALGVLGALGGCSDSQSTMPEAASTKLRDQVQEVREAATAGDVDAARGGLAEVHTTLEALRANGQISADHANRITAATDDVSRHLALLTTTTVPTPATAPPPTAPPPRAPGPLDEDSEEDDDEDDERGGKGPKENNGRGKGRD
ncbi:MAG TPA: hypothetical protein VGR26_08375 [Acidimicrobiales bacterium]|nr:hypothetical protein [Acidimicrobiales bacterium]